MVFAKTCKTMLLSTGASQVKNKHNFTWKYPQYLHNCFIKANLGEEMDFNIMFVLYYIKDQLSCKTDILNPGNITFNYT